MYFIPETVTEPPVYAFSQLTDSTYALDISQGHIRSEWQQTFRYGDIASISRQKMKQDSTRIIFTFSSLKDKPTVEYLADPPRFDLHFNRHLDSLFIVVIDPGHGGRSIGATGSKGSREKQITLEIARRLKANLKKKKDIRTFMTRNKDRDVSLFTRRQMANFWSADIFISIHTNSARNKKATHSEVYYASSRNYGSARLILNELDKALDNGRGFVRRRGFAVIRGNSARLGAFLVETLYLSNAEGERSLTSSKDQDLIARSLFQAIEKILSQAGGT